VRIIGKTSLDEMNSILTWGFWLYFARKIPLMAPRQTSHPGYCKRKSPTEEMREVADNSDEVVVLKMSYKLKNPRALQGRSGVY
jgi:hypothetical protein